MPTPPAECCSSSAPRWRTQPRTASSVRQATDLDEAEELLAGVYLPNRLQLLPGEAGINMELASVRFGTLTVGRLGYGRSPT